MTKFKTTNIHTFVFIYIFFFILRLVLQIHTYGITNFWQNLVVNSFVITDTIFYIY